VHALAAVLTLALALTSAAPAQMPQPGQQGQPPMQISGPQARMQEIQQTLVSAQEAAFDAHPELVERRDALEDLVVETMEDHGYDPEARMATLDSLRGKIQDPSLSQQARQQMMQTAQQAQQALQEGQQAAMQDSTVVEAQEDFRADLMDAMREQEPEVEQLIAEFEQLQQRARQQMMQQQMQQQQMQPQPPRGGGSPAPGGGGG
jgi:predicted RNA binding protein with dsRBD fold (UPF0201 family)